MWNCVEKHPPEEKPLTDIVSGFMLRLSSGELKVGDISTSKTDNDDKMMVIVIIISMITLSQITYIDK